MKAAHLAALTLAGFFATTAIAAQDGQDAPGAYDSTRTQESDEQRLPNDAHGYRNTNPGESSPDPRLDDLEREDRREHTDPLERDDERQPEQR